MPTPGRVRVTVYLDADMAEWGKHQAGGLSSLMRRLLADAHRQEAPAADRYPPQLRADYQRLIDRKLASGLTADEEQELSAIRARINALDRASPEWMRREQAAAAIVQEFAELRRAIEDGP
jgi:hypothetical protein